MMSELFVNRVLHFGLSIRSEDPSMNPSLAVHEAPGLKEMDNHPKRHQAGTGYILARKSRPSAQGSPTLSVQESVRAHCMNPSFAKCIPTYRGTNVHEAPGLKQTEIHPKRHQAGADYIPEVRSTD
uniref:Uncharacterized protein n=1 Tax=Trichuris muris TaxID=70415 RepID=A0A5S6QM87_TRIMR